MKTLYHFFCLAVVGLALLVRGCEPCRAQVILGSDPAHYVKLAAPPAPGPQTNPEAIPGVLYMAVARPPPKPPPAVSVGWDWNTRTDLVQTVRVTLGHVTGVPTLTNDLPLSYFSNAPSPVVTLSPYNPREPLWVQVQLIATNGFTWFPTPELWVVAPNTPVVYPYGGSEWLGVVVASNKSYYVSNALTGQAFAVSNTVKSNSIVGVKLPAGGSGFYRVGVEQ